MHVASYIEAVDDPKDMIDPTVAGALGILHSAAKPGSTVKRVVYTSSAAAISFGEDPPRAVNENDWNEHSLKEVEEKGREAHFLHKYCALINVHGRSLKFLDLVVKGLMSALDAEVANNPKTACSPQSAFRAVQTLSETRATTSQH